jgi:hypothetical protein
MKRHCLNLSLGWAAALDALAGSEQAAGGAIAVFQSREAQREKSACVIIR